MASFDFGDDGYGDIGFVFIKDSIGDCPDPECVECHQQSRDKTEQWAPNITYVPPYLTPRQADKIVSDYVTSIATDLGYLKAKIAAHGNTIINKWKKKSHQKRHDDLVGMSNP